MVKVAVYPKIPCNVKIPLVEPLIIKAMAIKSKITPRLRKISIPVVTILNRCIVMLAIPYESKARVIKKAPNNDNIFILTFSQK